MEEVVAGRTRKRSRRAARGGSLVSRGEREDGGEKVEPHISEHLLHVQKNLILVRSQSGNGSQHAADPSVCMIQLLINRCPVCAVPSPWRLGLNSLRVSCDGKGCVPAHRGPDA